MTFVTAEMEFVSCMNCAGSLRATLGPLSFVRHGCPTAPIGRNQHFDIASTVKKCICL